MAADLAFLTSLPGPQHHAVPPVNARYRSRTEEARGSNPLTSTPPLMTSPNAGHLYFWARLVRPHNGWTPHDCATFRRMVEYTLSRLVRSFERHLRAENRSE